MLKNKKLNYFLLAILAIFIVIEVVGLVCSPNPSPSYCDQNKTYQENNGTVAAIFFPIIRNTFRGINCILDWIGTYSSAFLVLATIAIAVFTWSLYWATTGLLKTANNQAMDNLRAIKASERSAQAAETAADVARKSVDIISAIERAYLFVKVQVKPSHEFTYEKIKFGGSDQEFEFIPIEIIVTNHGKTPAVLMNVDHICDIFEDRVIDDLAQFHTNVVKVKIVPGEEIIRSGEIREPFKEYLSINSEKRALLTDDINPVYRIVCFGRIQYKDIFGQTQDTIFCWQWGNLIEKFYVDKRDHKRNKQT